MQKKSLNIWGLIIFVYTHLVYNYLHVASVEECHMMEYFSADRGKPACGFASVCTCLYMS